jgi:integrase
MKATCLAAILNGGWHGWHAFRRGIATRLFAVGIEPKIVQLILRHADVSTTRAHYVLPDDGEVKKAMARFSKALRGKK